MVESILKNITVETKSNVYFDGRVTSRTCYQKDGRRFTLGVINTGIYTFDVGEREIVQLISGTAEILLPAAIQWRSVSAPDRFEVPSNCQYQIRTTGIVEYLCKYYPE